MFAQLDLQPNGTWLVTATTSHQPDPRDLPAGRLSVPFPDGVTVQGGDSFTPTDPANPSAGGTFTAPPPTAQPRRVSKTAFLGLIPPALYKAWAMSTDATLMYGMALFNADTTVDIDNPAIPAVFAQALQLQLIDAPTAAAIQAAIRALVT